MAPEPAGNTGPLDITEDAVLGGRLRLRQPRRGHRVGHDAILLAAATPARAGERVVDLGAGVGAAGLAVAKRVDGLRLTLVEIDPALCALARENAALNGLSDVDIRCGDVAALRSGEIETTQRVLMNPPFNDSARYQVSPDAARRLAHAGNSETLKTWVDGAERLLGEGGTLTIIWRADGLADVEQAVRGAFGGLLILPVLPRQDAAAIRVVVRAEKGSTRGRRALAGLVLNEATGKPTPAAESILREGNTLPLANF
jgi:tRNA1(Val) A37 N6-methylase TrmN6